VEITPGVHFACCKQYHIAPLSTRSITADIWHLRELRSLLCGDDKATATHLATSTWVRRLRFCQVPGEDSRQGADIHASRTAPVAKPSLGFIWANTLEGSCIAEPHFPVMNHDSSNTRILTSRPFQDYTRLYIHTFATLQRTFLQPPPAETRPHKAEWPSTAIFRT
jgi:hypothetical protein